MKRGESKQAVAAAVASERRKFVRATLVGSALIAPKGGGRACTAALHNVNKNGPSLTPTALFPPQYRRTGFSALLIYSPPIQQGNMGRTLLWGRGWGKGSRVEG